ncbi:MAG: ABC transporter ATP-binding protein [Kiritimatiellaeota bacterium]|nr:ABC transporter ATP-binding protein [Kiritimatiellota bacterium]
MFDDDTLLKRQSFKRILKYALPYKGRLAIGILAGFVVAGSLFSSFMLIPQILKGVVPERAGNTQAVKTAERVVAAVEADPSRANEKKIAEVVRIISPPKRISVKEKVYEFKRKAAKWGIHLPVEYENRRLVFTKWIHFSIKTEDENGKMHWQFFSIFVLGFILLWTLKNLATYVNRYFTRWVGTRVVADLRNEIFHNLLGQSLKFYGKIDVGQLISRCTNDTAAIESAVANTIADATRCPLEVLACASAIIYFSAQTGDYSLPLILFLGLPAAILPLILLGRRIRRIYRNAFRNIAMVVSRMHEIFTGILIVKAYHAEEKEYSVFKSVNRKYFRTVVSALKTELLMAPAMEVVAVGATLVFLVYSYARGVTLTDLALLLVPAFMAYQPIKKIAKIKTYLERSMAAADRYFQLIDTDTSIKEAANPIKINEFNEEISFNDIHFTYEDKPLFQGLSLAIKKGEIVAVVGETGSGKTTIANLIARFYDVESGSVTIDGIDVKKLELASLRSLIGVVTQDPLLFNDTIANNIAYSKEDASMDEIIVAAKQANAHDFIIDGRHPDGYDTVVGEKGSKLSGGEKQRVSIARAMLKNPPIMILDEATSALDTVTERLVQDALNHLMENRTVFAIAHRLSTIRHADKIIVLDQGKIIESGTHGELLKANGKYKHLHDIQFGREPASDPEAAG